MQDGAHYMIYTPSDPLLFVAVKVPSEISKLLYLHYFNTSI